MIEDQVNLDCDTKREASGNRVPTAFMRLAQGARKLLCLHRGDSKLKPRKFLGSNVKEKTSSDIEESHKIVCQRIYREIQPSLNVKCDVCVLSSYKNLFLFLDVLLQTGIWSCSSDESGRTDEDIAL